MVNLKEKLLNVAQIFDLSKAELARKMGISKSNFVGESLKSELNGASLVKFCEQFPEVSAEWLLRDQGPMLKSEIKEATEQNINNGVNVGHIGSHLSLKEHNLPKDSANNADLIEIIRKQQEQIDKLIDTIAHTHA